MNLSKISPSAKGNNYFDVQIRTSPESTNMFRFMTSKASQRQLFLEKKNAAQPITITGLTPTDYGISYFNDKRSSIATAPEIDFPFVEETIATNLISLKDVSVGSLHTVTGEVMWSNEEKLVTVRGSALERLREAIIADDTFHLPISIWDKDIDLIPEKQTVKLENVSLREYKGHRLSTTTTTCVTILEEKMEGIQWDQVSAINNSPDVSTICCPDVMSVKIAIYPVCNGKDKQGKLCGKKVVPTPGVKVVKCHACSCSMHLSKCMCDLNVEVRL